MQDNAPCHTSSKAKKWFKDNNITLLEWPAQSPDTNPIENVWYYLERRVRNRQNELKTLDDLWIILFEETKKIDKNYIKKFYKSTPRRINVLKEKN